MRSHFLAIALLAAAAARMADAQEVNTSQESVKCDRPLATAVLIDDTINTPSWTADQLRLFRLPALAFASSPIVAQSGCFTLLDPDPIFAYLANAAQPELILRVRAVALRSAEPNLAAKADTAVRRYIASYLGGSDADVPILQSVRVNVQVLCARQRRVVREFSGEAEAAESKSAEMNSDLLIAALTSAYAELHSAMRVARELCAEPTPPTSRSPATQCITYSTRAAAASAGISPCRRSRRRSNRRRWA